jgi:hypothetical protein
VSRVPRNRVLNANYVILVKKSPLILFRLKPNFSTLLFLMIISDEIFGPVALIIPFESDEHALDLANETDFGLAAGIFTNDFQRANVYARKLVAGNVYINTFNNTCKCIFKSSLIYYLISIICSVRWYETKWVWPRKWTRSN